MVGNPYLSVLRQSCPSLGHNRQMSSKLECGGRENDRETGWCSTNGIPVDCARSGDYFDRLDEPTGCTLISSALRGPGSQEGNIIAPTIPTLVPATLLLPTSR